MKYVIDASVAVKWVVLEKHADKAIQYYEPRSKIKLIAPDLLLPECLNALQKKVKNDEFDITDLEDAISIYMNGFSEFVSITDVFIHSTLLSDTLNHSIYDCIYLATATQRDSVLITADDVFYKKAKNSEYKQSIQWIDSTTEIS